MTAESNLPPKPAKAGSTNQTAIRLSWGRSTTPLEAIERTLYALADQVTGAIKEVTDEWELMAYPRASSVQVESLKHRIRQEVNDQTLRLRIAERTDPIRNLVFALAFSRADLSLTHQAPDDQVSARHRDDLKQ